MTAVLGYHRPESIKEAVQLIQAGGTVLSGGTKLNRNTNPFDEPAPPRDLVDIQDLGLDEMSVEDGVAAVGARVTLQDLHDSNGIPAVVREAARREAPRPTRNASTVGGLVAGRTATSELLATLLAHRAEVVFEAADGQHRVSLAHALDEGIEAGLITEIRFETDGEAAAGRVGRTPSDEPIVATVVRRDSDGTEIVAMSGVAEAPVIVDANSLESLDPPGDFRGSPEYRRHLAAVLIARARREVGS
jgi:CO/xanthine dehydrogenase FAD-binding subunit